MTTPGPGPRRQPYDPRCERFDVALAAVIRLYKCGHWTLLRELDITRADHAAAIDAALLYLDGPVKRQDNLFALIQAVPALRAAAETLREQYPFTCARGSRRAYYESRRHLR